MFRSRRRRLQIALIALCGMLFQQWSLAAHLCVIESSTPPMAAQTAQHAPCHADAVPTTAQTLLCAQHCSAVTPSPDLPPVPGVPPLAPLSVWPTLSLLSTPDCGLRAAVEVEARATAPPLSVRDCSYQI